jgi:hypothetical protein
VSWVARRPRYKNLTGARAVPAAAQVPLPGLPDSFMDLSAFLADAGERALVRPPAVSCMPLTCLLGCRLCLQRTSPSPN